MTLTTSHLPAWPALLQHHGDAELEFIPDATAFDRWQTSSTPAKLIDTEGRIFEIDRDKHLRAAGYASLEEILGLIRAHALLEGVCCTPKLGAPDIPSAMTVLSSLVEA
ncbi:DUF4144 family protein [Methylobacillus sp. Pita2]|uniref:DUF4144 family protein n=1 Tax=Methylobacillus sp. Pita2 TaxID=3383245 RepID=UPI0038B6346D